MTWGPRTKETLLSLPSMVWLIGLFLVPTLLVFAISFRPSTPFGGVGEGWTLETSRGLANPNYPTIIWRTVWISLSTTAICLTLAVPCAYFMARAPVRWRSFLVMLVIIPFWTNFLIRIFAWKIMLHPEGLLKKFLLMLHLVEPRTILMYNEGAVLLVAGLLLLLPGFITDGIGFLLLIPPVRRGLLLRLLDRSGVIQRQHSPDPPGDRSGPRVIEGEFRREDDS